MQVKFIHILNIKAVAIAITLLSGIISCTGPLDEMEFSSNSSYTQIVRPEGATLNEAPYFSRRVFVLFSFGYNNLSFDLKKDIEEMLTGQVPKYGFGEDVVLVLSHGTSGGYSKPSSPTLTHIYSRDSKIIRDTLKVYPDTTIAVRGSFVKEVLTFAKKTFPARSYGMLMSSHGTGWAPQGYCYSPPDKKNYFSSSYSLSSYGYGLEKYHQERPLVKSIGAHYQGSGSRSLEIEIQNLADAIPMHLDYIIFDACLMGCIEVAYELREKCDRICFSQTEILSGGMNYKNLLSSLFGHDEIDLCSFAEDYFNMYAKNTSADMRSATVSVVDCRKLDRLAQIVAKNSESIYNFANNQANRETVQQYFRPIDWRYKIDYPCHHGIFFDLQDIIEKAGANDEDLKELEAALNECIVCKYATERFLDEFDIEAHSGLSMYLYDSDRYILNKYYKTLKWEQDVRLIK